MSVALGVGASARADVGVYAPDGTPRGVLAGVPWIGCISPSGRHLISPGAGMWDNAGSPLASAWSSVTRGDCVADRLDNVYVAGKVSTSDWTVTKYSLTGQVLQTYHVTPLMTTLGFALDLGADECTLYYGAYAPLGTKTLGRFDVCTGTQLPMLPPAGSSTTSRSCRMGRRSRSTAPSRAASTHSGPAHSSTSRPTRPSRCAA